jgi:hypothetical protein
MDLTAGGSLWACGEQRVPPWVTFSMLAVIYSSGYSSSLMPFMTAGDWPRFFFYI